MSRKSINRDNQPKQLLNQEEQEALVETFLITMFLTIALISGFAIVTL
jgi:hypothetical protein